MSSSSKLLRKFHDIRAYRSTKNNFEEDPIFQEKVAADRLKANEERPRSYRKASEEIVYVVEDYPGFRPTTAFNNNLARKNRLDKASRPHSGQ
jgi:antibiotic biosynthesis monooxygenase (ABM) superfamily enzyme